MDMTTSSKKADVILGSDNYFHWEFAMRMTLARKGLLALVQVVMDPTEYELISSIVENSKDVTLIEVKEKLLKEYERQEKKDASERALKATSFGGTGKNRRFDKVGKGLDRKCNGGRKIDRFKGKCFNCDKFGHLKRDSPEQVNGDTNEDSVFAVDLFEYTDMSADMFVTVADAKKIRVAGTGSVVLTGIDGKWVRMEGVLHIPGLDRRLLSVGKLAERGMSVE
ncbi:Integrase, catalytic core protein [Phytophthora cinnamomi]|uniref:Integrase, catalytic core protein n=1 Tax=Phytophthora cinnamomi TaxID=4785 RepID=UPI003559754D|nr:Integrase, catalytic core protein [Phytophthora cinnamomi]